MRQPSILSILGECHSASDLAGARCYGLTWHAPHAAKLLVSCYHVVTTATYSKSHCQQSLTLNSIYIYDITYIQLIRNPNGQVSAAMLDLKCCYAPVLPIRKPAIRNQVSLTHKIRGQWTNAYSNMDGNQKDAEPWTALNMLVQLGSTPARMIIMWQLAGLLHWSSGSLLAFCSPDPAKKEAVNHFRALVFPVE